MNLAELEKFIEELNDQLRLGQRKFNRNMRTYHDEFDQDLFSAKKELSETELRVYVKISNYFRLTTITIPDLTIAYEIWLKGILPVLLQEVGLNIDNWDEICTIGDHTKQYLERIDFEWPTYLEEIKLGNMNQEVWNLIQTGIKRSKELQKRKFIRKKRSE